MSSMYIQTGEGFGSGMFQVVLQELKTAGSSSEKLTVKYTYAELTRNFFMYASCPPPILVYLEACVND